MSEKKKLDGQFAHMMLSRGAIGTKYIKSFKKIVDGANKVKDLLAESTTNDPFYASSTNKARAEWFKELWIKEGKPIIHLKAIHYRIAGKGYEYNLYNKQGNIESKELYENTEQAWNIIQEAYKFARYFKLIPYDLLPDKNNPNPTLSYYPSELNHKKLDIKIKIKQNIGYYSSDYYITHKDDIEGFIDKYIDDMVNSLFENVAYSQLKLQPNYIEIWAEKSGIIPYDIAGKYNATIRPSGKGEFSLTMCIDAIKKAKARNKTLHIFILSDFDPKGRDMPKSIARKIEVIARQKGITAFVDHIGLTKKQCIKYTLPTNPAKTPKGTSTGAKAYKTQTELFKRFAGRHPTEINAFEGMYPTKYAEVIEKAIGPCYDLELEEKINDATSELINEISTRISDIMESKKDIIKEKRDNLIPIIDKMNEFIKEKETELDLKTIVDEYEETLKIDLETVLEGVDITLPEPKVEELKSPLLDTRRSYFEQIQKYKNFDFRYSQKKS